MRRLSAVSQPMEKLLLINNKLLAFRNRLIPAQLLNEFPVSFLPLVNRDNPVERFLFRARPLQAYLYRHNSSS